MFSGTALAQCITLAATAIVICRLYTPAEFGTYGDFVAILSVLGALVTMQYAQALVLPKRDGAARALLTAALLCVGATTLLATIVSLVFPSFLPALMHAPHASHLGLLFPLGVATLGATQALEGWCTRVKQFRRMSGGQVARASGTCAGQIFLGWAGALQVGLLAGSVCGEALSATVMLRAIRPAGRAAAGRVRLSVKRLACVMRRYVDFPAYAAPQNALNAISQGLPVLLLTHYFGAASAGFYALAVRLIEAPMRLVLSPLRPVLFQKMTEVRNAGGDVRQLHRVATLTLLATGIVPALILVAFSPALFAWLLGEEWRESGEYGRWLIVWLLPTFCNPPSTLAARILRRQHSLLIFDIISLVGRGATIFVGAEFLSSVATVALFSLVGGALNIGLICWVGVQLGRLPKEDVKS